VGRGRIGVKIIASIFPLWHLICLPRGEIAIFGRRIYPDRKDSDIDFGNPRSRPDGLAIATPLEVATTAWKSLAERV
jgi:hypothetical protein